MGAAGYQGVSSEYLFGAGKQERVVVYILVAWMYGVVCV